MNELSFKKKVFVLQKEVESLSSLQKEMDVNDTPSDLDAKVTNHQWSLDDKE